MTTKEENALRDLLKAMQDYRRNMIDLTDLSPQGRRIPEYINAGILSEAHKSFANRTHAALDAIFGTTDVQEIDLKKGGGALKIVLDAQRLQVEPEHKAGAVKPDGWLYAPGDEINDKIDLADRCIRHMSLSLDGYESSGPTYTPGFASMTWNGHEYTFTVKQRGIVKQLWDAYWAGVPDVADATLLNDAWRARLRDVFKSKAAKMHPAWGSLIIEGEKRGTHRITPPPVKKLSKKSRSPR